MDREYKRIENELSEPDMAAYLDITANSYSRIERGEVKCDLPKLFIICQMLDISADYILFGKAKNNDGLTQEQRESIRIMTVSYTHLRAHETGRNLVCRLLLEKNFFLMIRRPPRYTLLASSAASDVYKRQDVLSALQTTL